MQFSKGNEKLGDGCLVVSRAVGDTCPSTCDFLGNGCYAENTENIFKNSRAVGLRNMITEKNLIRAMIVEAIKKEVAIRWHERGDFFKNGELDCEYVDNIVWACESLLSEGKELPDMWVYSHIYDTRIVDKLSKYMVVYASVHNSDHKEAASNAGFKYFAWCDTDNVYSPKKPRGKAKVEAWRKALPKLAIIDNERYITCPEMRRGRQAGGVTCTGTKDSVECNLCVKGLANVLFLNH
jgi:hypothetical protein